MIDEPESEAVVDTQPKRPRPPRPIPRHPNGDVDRLAQLEAEVAELRRQAPQTMQTIPGQPEPRPEVFPADPNAAVTPLMRKLLERTFATPPDYTPSGVTYNHKNRWFCRPDGDIVELPGSPDHVSMYLEMGFSLLNEDETRQWLEHDREIVVKDQRERARLINAVRAAAKTDPKLAYAVSDEAETDMQRMSTPELRERAHAVVGDMKLLQRPQRLVDAEEKAATRRDKQMLAGLETVESMSMEGLEQKKQRSGGRSIEISPGTRRR